MKVGSLFSGIGGFDLGLERAGMQIEWQVEIDEYCRRVLRKHWPNVPCHYDIKAIDWKFIPHVDLVCGGFPCQPFSCAGKRKGKDDDRYLWPEVVRCIQEIKPAWFLGENVPGLLHLGIEQVLADLEAIGYETATLGIPACGVDAPHIRQRIWILAHRNGRRSEGENLSVRSGRQDEAEVEPERSGTDVADSRRLSTGRIPGCRETQGSWPYRESAGFSRWLPEPRLGRVAHGIPHRVDRLKGLGNAIVPQIAEALGWMILEVF